MSCCLQSSSDTLNRSNIGSNLILVEFANRFGAVCLPNFAFLFLSLCLSRVTNLGHNHDSLAIHSQRS